MTKKCIICHEEASFKIKDTSDYYCKECAEDNFADLSVLVTMEEEAQKLKNFVKEKNAGAVQEDVPNAEDRKD